MGAIEQFGDRVIKAILGTILSLLFAVFAKILTEVNRLIPDPSGSADTSVDMIIAIFSAGPTIFDLIAIIVATLAGGPFGFFGALLEIAGGNALIQGNSGIELVIVGALFVVIGSLIWSWSGFFRLMNSSRRRGY